MSVTGLKLLRCQQCSAGLNHAPGQALLACAFCGNRYLVEGVPLSGGPAPVRMLRFALDAAQARDRFVVWLGQGWFRPADLVASTRIKECAAVFLPVYVGTGRAKSNWVAQITIKQHQHWEASASLQARSGSQWDERTHLLTGQHEAHYENLTTLASLGAKSAFYRDVDDYPWERLVPFDLDAVGTAVVEEPVVTLDEAKKQLRAVAEEKEHAACAAMIPGGPPREIRVATTLDFEWCDLAYVPAFTVSYEYRGQSYAALVNGVTGSVGGTAPVSGSRVAVAVAIGAGVTATVLWILRRLR